MYKSENTDQAEREKRAKTHESLSKKHLVFMRYSISSVTVCRWNNVHSITILYYILSLLLYVTLPHSTKCVYSRGKRMIENKFHLFCKSVSNIFSSLHLKKIVQISIEKHLSEKVEKTYAPKYRLTKTGWKFFIRNWKGLERTHLLILVSSTWIKLVYPFYCCTYAPCTCTLYMWIVHSLRSILNIGSFFFFIKWCQEPT